MNAAESKHRAEFEAALKTCNSMADVFATCNKFYHLDQKLLPTYAAIVRAGILTAVQMISPKIKQ